MALFEKKKQQPVAEPPAPPSDQQSAVDIVREMKSRNYSNNQIVEYLQRQGLKSDEIFDAMNEADVGSAAGPIGMNDPSPNQFSAHTGPIPNSGGMMPPQSMGMDLSSSKEQIEEIAESVVEEKFEDLEKDFKKISDWKDGTEARLIAIEQRLIDLSKSFDGLHQGVLGKIDEYDKGIVEVGTEIKALEKVFSKILPTFTENVSELSRITQKLKSSSSLSASPKKL